VLNTEVYVSLYFVARVTHSLVAKIRKNESLFRAAVANQESTLSAMVLYIQEKKKKKRGEERKG